MAWYSPQGRRVTTRPYSTLSRTDRQARCRCTPKHADDVAAVVEAARGTALPLFVRSGAHHAAAHSTGDGLLLDLGSLTDLDIDLDSGAHGREPD